MIDRTIAFYRDERRRSVQVLTFDGRVISGMSDHSSTVKFDDGSTVNDARDGVCWTYVRKTANVKETAVIRVHVGRLTEISA